MEDLAVLAYRYLVAAGERDDERLSDVTGVSPTKIDEAYRALADLKLVESGIDTGKAWRAVSPHVAIARLVTPIEAEARQRSAEAERLRSHLQRFVPVHAAADTSDSKQIEVITDDAELSELIDGEMVLGEGPLLMMWSASSPCPSRDQLLSAARNGMGVRVAYPHAARYSLPVIGLIEALTEEGVRFRTVGAAPIQVIVIGARLCVVRVPAVDRDDVAIVVRHPLVVSLMVGVFDGVWERSVPFDHLDPQPKSIPDDTRREVLRLMATGSKDEVIARKLGISVRTCRRHISDIMQDIGATSRFQAGVVSRSRGLV